MQWEYRVEGVEVGKYYDELFELFLKRLGAEGWELVHITERKSPMMVAGHTDQVHLKAYFKRPVSVQPVRTMADDIAAQIEAGGVGRRD